MCAHCRLATPPGHSDLCPGCAIDLRAAAGRGLNEIAAHLDDWTEFERWLADQPLRLHP